MKHTDTPIDQLVQHVRHSRKYRQVCEDLIRRIGAKELTNRRHLKAALKATKNTLHQIGGAYFTTEIDYRRALTALQHAAETQNPDDLRTVCRTLMGLHASTKERLPILNEFYTTLFADIQPVHAVLDVACGLNPLAIPWMPLTEPATYMAYDIYDDMMAFLQEFLGLVGISGQAETCDVTQSPPTQPADVALMLKLLPCLEHIEKNTGFRLLEKVRARYIIVSFPVHSLGRRKKGMTEHYEQTFLELIRQTDWSVKQFSFATELVFLVTKYKNLRETKAKF